MLLDEQNAGMATGRQAWSLPCAPSRARWEATGTDAPLGAKAPQAELMPDPRLVVAVPPDAAKTTASPGPRIADCIRSRIGLAGCSDEIVAATS
jgi:hypothetical protein